MSENKKSIEQQKLQLENDISKKGPMGVAISWVDILNCEKKLLTIEKQSIDDLMEFLWDITKPKLAQWSPACVDGFWCHVANRLGKSSKIQAQNALLENSLRIEMLADYFIKSCQTPPKQSFNAWIKLKGSVALGMEDKDGTGKKTFTMEFRQPGLGLNLELIKHWPELHSQLRLDVISKCLDPLYQGSDTKFPSILGGAIFIPSHTRLIIIKGLGLALEHEKGRKGFEKSIERLEVWRKTEVIKDTDITDLSSKAITTLASSSSPCYLVALARKDAMERGLDILMREKRQAQTPKM